MSEKIEEFVHEKGIEADIIKLDKKVSTVEEASEALDVPSSQIAKAIIFKDPAQSKLYMCICSGAKKVNVEKIESVAGADELKLAKPSEIKERLGFEVGGVPPFGFDVEIDIYLDGDLMNYKYVFASGGSENSMMKIDPNELKKYSRAKIINLGPFHGGGGFD